MQVPYDTAIAVPETYPKEMKTCSPNNLCRNINNSTIFKPQTSNNQEDILQWWVVKQTGILLTHNKE